jgi:hypothetical protein
MAPFSAELICVPSWAIQWFRQSVRVAMILLATTVSWAAEGLRPLPVQPPESLRSEGIPRRLIAIDNVCAWPNVVRLENGSLVAIVFNQPNHGHTEGDVDCWGSDDGRFWKYLSTITRHAPETVRMNHAAGLNADGHLVVLCNGWDKIAPRRNAASRPVQTVGALSRDAGKTWEQLGAVLPEVSGLSWHVPFGDILSAANGDLVAGTYAFTRPNTGNVYAARSRDGGRTWSHLAPIAQDRHVEAAMLHLGGGRWLAASRRFEHLDLDLFASDDDALTWKHMTTLDVKPVSSAHLLKLSDGRVLLTYGNRTPGNRGIDARLSNDGGRTWTSPQRLIALETGDCGYPDAVEMGNGRVLVSYYADGVPEHQRYHMGVINVTLDELGRAANTALDYTLELRETFPPSTEGGSWFQPRTVAIPSPGDRPLAVMTIQKSLGSDFFSGLSTSKSTDGGKTWSTPLSDPGLGWREAEDNLKIGVCDITLGWHAATRKVIGIGHTVRYTPKGFAGIEYRRDTAWTSYDPLTDRWTPWKELAMPETEDRRYFINGVHGQWLIEPDGSLLVPMYLLAPNIAGPKWNFPFRGVVARLAFDGHELSFKAAGNELLHPVPRGFYEKSITRFRGRYYMTIRNDEKGYVGVSDDGMNYRDIRAWTFDDGGELGSYNTQQKWVTHSDGLFLVYTRRGAKNDHIPRNRAPLFIAQVDPEKLHVIRATERIAVPERGKDLGNFDATNVNESETWITVAGGPAYLARIQWAKPNLLVRRAK